jgi:hypothetical protein
VRALAFIDLVERTTESEHEVQSAKRTSGLRQAPRFSELFHQEVWRELSLMSRPSRDVVGSAVREVIVTFGADKDYDVAEFVRQRVELKADSVGRRRNDTTAASI